MNLVMENHPPLDMSSGRFTHELSSIENPTLTRFARGRDVDTSSRLRDGSIRASVEELVAP